MILENVPQNLYLVLLSMSIVLVGTRQHMFWYPCQSILVGGICSAKSAEHDVWSCWLSGFPDVIRTIICNESVMNE